MPTLEERLADLEGRMKPDLREEMVRGFERMREEMTRGFERTESRFERLESRVDLVEDRMHRQFTWLVGIQLTTMLTVIGVLAAAYFR